MRYIAYLKSIKFKSIPTYPAKLLAFVLLICLSDLGHAAMAPGAWSEENLVKLDKHFDMLFEQKRFSGALLLAQDGEIVYEKYLGVVDSYDKAKVMGPRSSFRLASVSKQFTAMAVMILKEQGKLNFDDDIQKHLPSLPYEGITIRHLLHHMAGMPDYVDWFENNWDIEKEYDDRNVAFTKDLIEQFAKHKPERLFMPGDQYEYSNTGYVMLAQIIENASGIPFRQFMQETLFTPLEMEDTQVYIPGKKFTVAERIYGYQLLADGLTVEENDWNFMNGMSGDGGIYSSAHDLLKWEQAWYTDKLVSQETIAQAYVSGKTNDGVETGYGFGWSVFKNSDGLVTAVSHDGGWVGFATMIQRNIKDNRTIILLTNDSGDGFDSILKALGHVYLGKELVTPLKNVNHELAAVVETDGIDAAIAHLEKIKDTTKHEYFITDNQLKQLENFYREQGQDEIAGKLEALVNNRPEVQLNKVQMDAFAGSYDLSQNLTINIYHRDMQLFAHATGQDELKLVAIEENRFKVMDGDAEFTFTNNEAGVTESLTLHQNGENQIVEKNPE